MSNEPIDFGEEPKLTSSTSENLKDLGLEKNKKDVNPYDIFKLATRILIWAACIFIGLALCRMFWNNDGVKEVWDYSKVVLNSIVSLVLGLYFGSKQNSDK